MGPKRGGSTHGGAEEDKRREEGATCFGEMGVALGEGWGKRRALEGNPPKQRVSAGVLRSKIQRSDDVHLRSHRCP